MNELLLWLLSLLKLVVITSISLTAFYLYRRIAGVKEKRNVTINNYYFTDCPGSGNRTTYCNLRS